MLTAAVWVETGVERQIRALVCRDDGDGAIFVEGGGDTIRRCFFGLLDGLCRSKAVGWVHAGPAAVGCMGGIFHDGRSVNI